MNQTNKPGKTKLTVVATLAILVCLMGAVVFLYNSALQSPTIPNTVEAFLAAPKSPNEIRQVQNFAHPMFNDQKLLLLLVFDDGTNLSGSAAVRALGTHVSEYDLGQVSC